MGLTANHAEPPAMPAKLASFLSCALPESCSVHRPEPVAYSIVDSPHTRPQELDPAARKPLGPERAFAPQAGVCASVLSLVGWAFHCGDCGVCCDCETISRIFSWISGAAFVSASSRKDKSFEPCHAFTAFINAALMSGWVVP